MSPLALPLLAGAAAAPVVGGILGGIFGGGAEEEAQAINRQMLEEIKSIPTPEQRAIKLEEYRQAGILSPQMEQTILSGDSELKKIETDPRLKQAQYNALSELENISSSGGLTAKDKAQLYEIQSQQAQAERGSREAALQQLQQRGIGSGGSAVTAAMMANQAAAQKASQQGMDVAAMAQDRALNAMMQAGQLGGSIREQEYGEKSAAAKAQDAINQFNISNRIGAQQRNVAAMNQAAAQNLAMQQDIANKNTATRNQQTQYNQEAAQREYQNQLDKYRAAQGAASGLAGSLSQQAQSTKQMWGGIGTGVGTGLGAYGLYSSLKDGKQ